MSQYPPPYSPEQSAYGGYPPGAPHGYPPEPPQSPEELLAPARRAGTLMIVVGALSVVCGLYIAWVSGNFDPSAAGGPPELQRQMQQQVEMFESQTGFSFRSLMLVMGVVPLVAGALLGGLGFYVRGGSLGFIIAGAVVVGGMLLITGAMLLVGLLQSAAMGGPVVAAAMLCQCGVPFVLLSVLMVWLVQAARVASRISLARQQYQAQVWQYQQYQQAYLRQQNASLPPQPAPPPGMGYHFPQPSASQPPTSQPPSPPPGQPPVGPPLERKDPPDGAPPAG